MLYRKYVTYNTVEVGFKSKVTACSQHSKDKRFLWDKTLKQQKFVRPSICQFVRNLFVFGGQKRRRRTTYAGSDMADLGSEMAELGSELAELASKMAELGRTDQPMVQPMDGSTDQQSS